MQLETLKELRRGCLVFKVLRSQGDGRRFVAVDRWNGGAVVRGPLLLERNFWRLWRVLGRDRASLSGGSDSWDSLFSLDKGALSRREGGSPEVLEGGVAEAAPVSSPGITVLPVMPEYRYVHTCPQCGCHVASYAQVSVGVCIKVCSGCGYGYSVSE